MNWQTYEIRFQIATPTFVVQHGWAIALVALLLALLAIRMGRRRSDERRLRIMSSVRHDFFPRADHPVIEEIRREVDESYRRYERRRLEERWRRDGSVLLERRKEA